MGKPISEIIHWQNITAVINEARAVVPTGILPDGLFKPTKQIIGQSGYFLKVQNTRRVAEQCMYGSPSKNIHLKGVSKVPVTLLHSFLHHDFDTEVIIQLKNQDESVQGLAAAEIGRQSREFAQLFVNLERACWYSALTTGKIMVDDDGELTMKSSEAAITVDFGVPAGNKNQCDALGAGNILAATWSTAGTDIAAQILNLQQASITLTGYPVKYAFYGKNVPGYVAGNDTMKEFLKFNNAANAAVIAGGIPSGFLDLIWRPAYGANYESKDGETHFFWADNCVVFTPSEADAGWFGYLEGSYPVPSDPMVYADGRAAVGALAQVFGAGRWAHEIIDPPGIREYGFDTFLPVVVIPKSIFISTVEF